MYPTILFMVYKLYEVHERLRAIALPLCQCPDDSARLLLTTQSSNLCCHFVLYLNCLGGPLCL